MSGYIQMNREYQSGAGLGEIDIYRGPNHHHFHRQGGAGIGKYIGRAYKYLKPLFSSGINAIKDQGFESTQSILSQLGEKKLKNILEEEGKKAVKNLKQKAINKINRSRNSQTQIGSGIGIPYGLSGGDFLSFRRKKKAKKGKVTKKILKTKKKGTKSKTKAKQQIGGKRKRKSKAKKLKKKKTQTGGRKKQRKSKKLRQLDVFD